MQRLPYYAHSHILSMNKLYATTRIWDPFLHTQINALTLFIVSMRKERHVPLPLIRHHIITR